MIPAKFKLGGATIRIKVVPLRRWPHPKDVEGMWTPSLNLIEILDEGGDPVHMQRVFVHEAVHACLDFAEYPKQSKDEKFVQSLADRFHQMWTTCEPNKKAAKPRKKRRGCAKTK